MDKDRLIAGIYNLKPVNNCIIAAPTNHAEIIIPVSDVVISQIGGTRSTKLIRRECYFGLPRKFAYYSKQSNHPNLIIILIIIKIDPLFAVDISSRLQKISRFENLFHFPCKLLNKSRSISSFDLKKLSRLIYHKMHLHIRKVNYEVVGNAIDLIESKAGKTSVNEICQKFNVTKGQLEHHFKKVTGIFPKEYCKIHKLNFFIKTYSPENTFTKHAHQCGYFDQSHLIKDFKYSLGITPKEYFK